MVTRYGNDISAMGRKPLFPVFHGIDLEPCDLSGNATDNGNAVLFGNSINYFPIGTVDDKNIQDFFSHIAATGDGNAKCKSDIGGFRWSHDVDFPVNGHDTDSNVFFGSG